ncbi:TonB-dependent receptor [Maribacter sp.]|uniref:TonB-dependent receptor n=1 Tax=Maribacter sp. TaxID=1897614 RepID=UPI0025BA7581|nr:TonB-dependent receptor [Maribacter sp.]
MLKTRNKQLAFLLFYVFLLFSTSNGNAQETNTPPILLKTHLKALEKTFTIKFSFIDTAISGFTITPTNSNSLDKQLAHIVTQTQLQIKKLSDRYYAISQRNSATIYGQILDNYKNEPLAGATIQAINTTKATIADSNGRFTLENITLDVLVQIKFLGYKPLFIKASALTQQYPSKKIALALKYQQLKEVIVYQFLTTGLQKKVNGSITINPDDFGILPGQIEPDILKTIQTLPGIKSIDETVSDINIRGGTNDQNLILWDGIKMYQSGHFFGLISAFNPYLTKSITSTKNGTSAQYGDGVSGVLNIKTKDALTESFFGGAGIHFISGDVYGQLPITEKITFQFSARRSVTDFFNSPAYDRFFDKVFQDSKILQNNNAQDIERNANFYFYDFTGKLLYNINENHKLRISFINISNTLDFLETQDQNPYSDSGLDQTNLSFGSSLQSDWNKYFTTNLNVYYTRYKLNAQNNNLLAKQILTQENEVLETAIKLTTKYTPNENFHWLNGYNFNEVGITNYTFITQPPFTSNIKGVVRTHALFSEIGYTSPNSKLFATIGGRTNLIENINTYSETILEPRINLSYALTEFVKIKAQGEFKSQSTNQVIDLEQNFLGIEKRRWILSDGDKLPITKSKQGSLGLNYDHHNLYIGVEGFYKKVKGISTATQGFQNPYQFNGEIGQYTIKGVEFLINQKSAFYSLWFSYAYNKNDYTFSSLVPQIFPNNLDIRHTATLAGTLTHKNLKLGIGLAYRSGKPFTKPQEGDAAINTNFFPARINYQEPNSSRLSEYMRADASATYTFKLNPKINAVIGASVLNLSGRENILNTYYRINTDNEIETIQRLSLGVTPNLSFRVTF